MLANLVVKDLTDVALVDGLTAGLAAVEVAGLVDRFTVLPADVIKVAGLDQNRWPPGRLDSW